MFRFAFYKNFPDATWKVDLEGIKGRAERLIRKFLLECKECTLNSGFGEWRKSRLERLEDSMDVIYDMNNERGE